MEKSLVGTLVPMFFKKIKIDPAVASGPLITTVNDLVAVVVYYGLGVFNKCCAYSVIYLILSCIFNKSFWIVCFFSR